jgi:hypothetical protein
MHNVTDVTLKRGIVSSGYFRDWINEVQQGGFRGNVMS